MSVNNNKTLGQLTIVATPIGNLDDISPRAIETLQNADLILAEDSRHFAILKQKFAISTPVKSYHEHNEKQSVSYLLDTLLSGTNIALVSDAGTPTISDPGYRLVKAAQEAEIKISAVPGPCAAIMALSMSGFETDRFYFEGFLPQKSGKRNTTLKTLLENNITSIVYESPYRILKTLECLRELDPERLLFIARELTKIYEETARGTASQLIDFLNAKKSIKGEFVLIIRGAEK